MSPNLPTVAQLIQLIGNPNVYAVMHSDGSGYFPVYEKLTPVVLRQHLDGERTIGTYFVWHDKAKALCFDVDSGTTPDFGLEKVMSSDAGLIARTLQDLGIKNDQIGVEFSGSKGWHVWVVMTQHVPAKDLRRLGRAVLAKSGVDCEVFPKQNKVEGLTRKGMPRVGNLAKLPGGLHNKTGKRAEMVTMWPHLVPPAQLQKVIAPLPEIEERKPRDVRDWGGLPCLTRIQEGPSEGWRALGLFQWATMLARNSVLPDNVELLVRATNEKCTPAPLESDQLDDIIDNAMISGPICSQLPADVQCEDCPVRRTKGLYTKPGQVRNGAEGEIVVLRIIGRRETGEVEFEHPDLDFCVGSPKKVPPPA